jgi:DNA invertase Pin-like site-specific DNA recombinase
MPAFAYARSGNADVELAVQLASLIDAGCSDIKIDRTHGRHPRDLRRRAALLETLGPGDTVMVYRLDCLAVSGVDLITTMARIRSRNAVLLTTASNGPNSFCDDTIDAIRSDDRPPRPAGRSAILGPADWPQVQRDCEAMSATAVAKRYKVSRSTLYNYIDRMRQGSDIVKRTT